MVSNAYALDCVVVGGGTAGSTLVNRISADGALVCLHEADPKDLHPFVDIPAK